MIREDLNQYENSDSEYAAALWDYARKFLTVEEAVDVIASHHSESGIEALEEWVYEGLEVSMPSNRPPSASMSAYRSVLETRLKEMPERLAVKVWESERDLWRGTLGVTESDLFAELEVLKAGESVFGVDLTDEIVEVAQELPECQTKVDLLEIRGAIDGDEWYERTDSLPLET